MRSRFWLVVAVTLLVTVTVFFALLNQVSDRHFTTHLTIHHAEYVVRGCLEYRAKSGGKFPATLDDLLRPPFEGGPFVDDWHSLDGHGQRLRLAVVANEQGEAEVFAWGERVGDGKTHLCGAKVKADSTVVLFGLPE